MVGYKKFYNQKKKTYTKNTKFSKNNLYKNRSSKKQAGQIYKLNKKINNIEKKTKPEIHNLQWNVDLSHEFSTSNCNLGTASNLYTGLKGIMKGDLVRIQNIQFYGYLHSSLTYAEEGQGYLDSYCRLIIVQNKTLNQSFPSDILLTQAASGGLACINSPYMEGFSQTVKLLYDKVYHITPDNRSRTFKFTLKKMDNLKKTTISNTSQYTGDIKIYAYIWSKTGYIKPETFTTITCKLYSKINYVDED